MKPLKQAREEKERGLSVKQAIEIALESESEIESIGIVMVKKNKEVEIALSSEDTVELVGMFELGRHFVADTILYPEE